MVTFQEGLEVINDASGAAVGNLWPMGQIQQCSVEGVLPILCPSQVPRALAEGVVPVLHCNWVAEAVEVFLKSHLMCKQITNFT